MVRLIAAFILLTLFSSCQQLYFYLSTITSEPAKQTVVFAPTSTATVIPGKNDITVLLYNHNYIYAYPGTNIRSGKKYDYNSFSNFLREKKSTTGDRMMIFIKPGTPGSYKNTVDILDQMAINNIKNYTLTDPSESERNFIKQLK